MNAHLPVPYQPGAVDIAKPDVWQEATAEEKASFVAFLTILPEGAGTDASEETHKEAYRLMLADRSGWALAEAKKLIANGRGGFGHRFRPSIPEVGQLLGRVMEPHVHRRQREEERKRRFRWDEDEPTDMEAWRKLGSVPIAGRARLPVLQPMPLSVMADALADTERLPWTRSETYRALMQQGLRRRAVEAEISPTDARPEPGMKEEGR